MTVTPEVGPLDEPLGLPPEATQTFSLSFDPDQVQAYQAVLYLPQVNSMQAE